MSNPSSESPDPGETDRDSDGEEEMLNLSRRSLLKLAAAGAAVLGFTGNKNSRASSEIDSLQLPNELEIDKIFIPENEKFALMTNNSGAKVLSFDPSFGSFDAQGKAMLNMSVTQFGESFRLPSQKTKMKTLENVEIPPRETKVLADLSGKKVVTSIWIATHGRARLGRDAMFRIYTDGSTKPDIEMDTGTLWANHLSAKGEPLLGSTRHMSVGSNWSDRRKTHMLMNFPIPCSEGIRIELQNTNSTNPGYIYSQVTYRDGVTAPFRLKGEGTNYLNRDLVRKNQSTYRMLDVSGSSGWLIWTSSCVNAKSNDSFMESDFELYVDGETEPSIKTSGWEDWYRSGYYYYRSTYDTPYMMCNARNSNANYTSVGLDLMELHGGLRFNSSLSTGLDLSDELNTDFELSWVQLYYEQKQ